MFQFNLCIIIYKRNKADFKFEKFYISKDHNQFFEKIKWNYTKTSGTYIISVNSFFQ